MTSLQRFHKECCSICSGPIYLHLDASIGLRPLPITRAWIELGDEVDAAYFYSDKIHLIRVNFIITISLNISIEVTYIILKLNPFCSTKCFQGAQVYAYQPDAPHALIEGYPKTVKEELGFRGHVDAAFICPNQQTLYAVQGKPSKFLFLRKK